MNHDELGFTSPVAGGMMRDWIALGWADRQIQGVAGVDEIEAGNHWNRNAEAWTKLARAGFDVYRDRLNTPAFLSLLPEVAGLQGLDLGCGEGHNTRRLASRGARMSAIDIAPEFIRFAMEAEAENPLGIDYRTASMSSLPFEDARFDFATAFNSLMDVPDPELALAEAFRVLKPGGFLQFSITHPCFDTPHRRNLRDADRRTRAIEVGRYFERGRGEISEWTFGAAPLEARIGLAPFRTPTFHRTLSDWLTAVIATGFRIEAVGEPTPTDGEVQACPDIQDAQVVAYFLHVRARKETR